MQTRVTIDEMKAAARQLAKSERGRAGMTKLLDALREQDPRLGLIDRASFSALLQGAWDGRASEVRSIIEDTLASTQNPPDAPGPPGAPR